MVEDPSHPSDTEELLAELSFAPAQGRKAKALEYEVVRGLRQEDLSKLQPTKTPQNLLIRIRHSHHQLAQGLAEGLPLQAVALSSGYDPEYICTLQRDPTFAELVEFYREQQKQAFTDVLTRMRQVGLDAVDELQERLAVSPEKFTHRDVMELCELMLVKAGHAGKASAPQGGVGAAAPPFALQINFRDAAPAERLVEAKVLEGEKV